MWQFLFPFECSTCFSSLTLQLSTLRSLPLCEICIENLKFAQHLKEPYLLTEAHSLTVGYCANPLTFQSFKRWKKSGGYLFQRLLLRFSQEHIQKLKQHNFDYLVPIPYQDDRAWKLKHRPTFEIARRLSRRLNLPLKEALIHTNDYQSSPDYRRQAEKDRLERLTTSLPYGLNFSVLNAKVLLVDDVLTTGATLNFCARKLLDGGALEVHAFVLMARPIIQRDSEILKGISSKTSRFSRTLTIPEHNDSRRSGP